MWLKLAAHTLLYLVKLNIIKYRLALFWYSKVLLNFGTGSYLGPEIQFCLIHRKVAVIFKISFSSTLGPTYLFVWQYFSLPIIVVIKSMYAFKNFFV